MIEGVRGGIIQRYVERVFSESVCHERVCYYENKDTYPLTDSKRWFY